MKWEIPLEISSHSASKLCIDVLTSPHKFPEQKTVSQRLQTAHIEMLLRWLLRDVVSMPLDPGLLYGPGCISHDTQPPPLLK